MADISESVATILNDASSTARRTANHHGNVWDDAVIQSLNSPYGAPAYHERVEKLIVEIRHLLLTEMDDTNLDLIKRLEIVDTLECLGIDRHFQHEIKTAALDYVYRCWNERGIGVGSRDSLTKDLNATALGFRALRLYRYNVSAGVLENFKNEHGKFFCNFSGDERVRSMLSLLRASEISFPGEKVMEEAKACTREYLNQVLAGLGDVTDVDQSLLREVKYALEFPWHCSVPRWEARSFIEIYSQNHSWLKSKINQKILELAKLDFNILQCIYQKETQYFSRWWSDSDIVQLNFYRKRHVEYYFWAVIGVLEPEFSQSRTALAKIATWKRFLEAYLEEAEWIATGRVPTFNEYIKNARASTGMCIANLIPLLLMGEFLPDNILEQIHSPSKIQELSELTIRLTDDLRDFEDEKERGEIASSIECYMKENPESTLENALNHIKSILHLSLEELNWEFLKQDSVPLCCKKFTFNVVRGIQFRFKYGDGFSISNKEVKEQIIKIIVEQVPIEEY